MNKLKTGLLLVLFLLIARYTYAQTYLPDGVMATASFKDELIANYVDENAMVFDLNAINTTAKIPVRVNVIKNRKGANGVTLTDINTGISNANSFFSKIGIQFILDTVNYISDYNYSYISYNKNRNELLNLYAVTNKINLFLADSINMDSINCYGFTYFPNVPDSNYIFLAKKYITENYLTTMFGHFMGLLSTHDTRGDREEVDEKNCAISGDFICDTYADPDLYNLVDTTCQYTGKLKDGKGKYYVPTVANIMSNSLDNCKCKFTLLQYRRMYYYFRKYRQNLVL